MYVCVIECPAIYWAIHDIDCGFTLDRRAHSVCGSVIQGERQSVGDSRVNYSPETMLDSSTILESESNMSYWIVAIRSFAH